MKIILFSPDGAGLSGKDLAMTLELDDFDHQILKALQAEARLSNLDLAARIPLSHSAISRRIKRLEDAKVIRGYHARIEPQAIGEAVRVLASVQREPQVPAAYVAESLARLPGIKNCWIVSGDCDVMVEITARDMSHFSEIMLDGIQKVPGVAATRSMFILTTVKER
ncbi:MAG: Lrp/AsnC family transcriptional regulator [Beijerinckiaceae bacterium]|nr:Lrp/AsnC family transcriptional regulator [Beijerinckiaceae bacterium]